MVSDAMRLYYRSKEKGLVRIGHVRGITVTQSVFDLYEVELEIATMAKFGPVEIKIRFGAELTHVENEQNVFILECDLGELFGA